MTNRKKMIVYGHRGARGEAPENTIAGCRHAVDSGVRRLEIDLRLSKDNELVVIHDPTVCVGNGKGNVAVKKLDSEKLMEMEAPGEWQNRLDCEDWKGRPDIKIPSLTYLVDELLEVEGWQLELKSGDKEYNSRLTKSVVEWLSGRDDLERFVVTSFNLNLCRKVLEQMGQKQKVGHVCKTAKTARAAAKTLAAHDALDCDDRFLVAEQCILDESLVKRLHDQKFHISAWNVKCWDIRRLWEMKVDSIITDCPSIALPLVKSLD